MNQKESIVITTEIDESHYGVLYIVHTIYGHGSRIKTDQRILPIFSNWVFRTKCHLRF